MNEENNNGIWPVMWTSREVAEKLYPTSSYGYRNLVCFHCGSPIKTIETFLGDYDTCKEHFISKYTCENRHEFFLKSHPNCDKGVCGLLSFGKFLS